MLPTSAFTVAFQKWEERHRKFIRIEGDYVKKYTLKIHHKKVISLVRFFFEYTLLYVDSFIRKNIPGLLP